jgi:ribonuclease-3
MPEGERENGLERLERKLGFAFRNRALLETALTHSSWTNEHGRGDHNERLEFLGDAVLELNISRGLYERFPTEREGSLTRLRARMVSEAMLAELAWGLDLGEFLLMGRGEEAQGGRTRPALLADAVEALLGAAFLDGGHAEAAGLVDRLYEGRWPVPERARKDCKTLLQEWTQARFRALPVYVPLPGSGPEHARVFRVRLDLPDGLSFHAEGSNMKRAEQNAARQALERCAARGSTRKTPALARAPEGEPLARNAAGPEAENFLPLPP